MPRRGSINVAVIGEVFGRLTVIGYGEKQDSGHTPRICKCECGKETVVITYHLKSGAVKSCGCLIGETNRANAAKRPKKYPGGKPKGYGCWKAMVYRCCDERSKDYPRYGGRGIKVCDRWLSFDSFIEDMGPQPSEGMQIDRFPNQDGNYEPGNCRWASVKEQANNRHNNRMLTHDGVTLSISEWAQRIGMKVGTLARRIRYNWPVEKALTTPV